MSDQKRLLALCALIGAALLAIEPSPVTISGDDIIPLTIERAAPRYSGAANGGWSATASTMTTTPAICVTTTTGSATQTIAYATTATTGHAR